MMSVENNIQSSTATSNPDQGIFPSNLRHDPHHTLDGMLILRCFFCNAFQTPIEHDMKVHLLEKHRTELITHLPIRGKGFNMDYRTAFVIDFLKRRKPHQFYDHMTAKFVSFHAKKQFNHLSRYSQDEE